jgi:protein-S-isoprenylcysteine O-methyltransferase Ste14
MNKSEKAGSIVIRIGQALFFCILAATLFGLPLFLSAGSLRFTGAWLFLGVFCISVFFIFTYLAIKDPGLFEKRMKMEEEDLSQTIIKLSLTLIYLVTLIVSGLDYRFHWSRVPRVVVLVFTILEAFGAVVLFIVMKQNTYGSRAVEIQENQRVIDSGLYSVVRHPLYLAFSIIFCFSPLVLGSFYAFILSLLMPVLIAMRIRKEEELLRKGLQGYEAYLRKVRFKLIPYVW